MTGSVSSTEPEVEQVRFIEDGVELRLVLPEWLFYFQGHFPTRPILPGVAQIDWAVRMADRYLGTAIGGARQIRVKFRSVISPGPLTLRLRRRSEGAKLDFEYVHGDAIVSFGTIDLTA